MNYYDMHAHVLPGMDDGCKSCEESVSVLQESYQQGVMRIVATPHYYPKESVQSFLNRRETSYRKLCKFIQEQDITDIPEIYLGAEVAYRSGISREPDLSKLTYGNSPYLLLELPFSRWGSGVLRDLMEITHISGLKPVIAHLERYAKYQDRKTLNQLFEEDVLIQMNAEYFLDFWTQGKAKKQIREGSVHILGSDTHNPSNRPPNVGKAAELMLKKGMDEDLQWLMDQAEIIFEKM